MKPTLGTTIRDARMRLLISGRELGRRCSVSPSYISDIENNLRVPSEPVLKKIAMIISLDAVELSGLIGRLDSETRAYVLHNPIAFKLLQTIARANLNEQQLRVLIDQVP